MAQIHGVAPFLSDMVHGLKMPDDVKNRIQTVSQRTVMQSYRLLFLCKYLIGKLEEAGIPILLLKGVGTASLYAVPELRKSGDVDLLLLEPEKLTLARSVLEQSGCIIGERQSALHHVVFYAEGNIEIELHTMLAEPFDNNKINKYLENLLPECREHIQRKDIMGVELPILTVEYHAYELLLHMLQHFLRSGFGLKLLCDWVVLWRHTILESEKERYLKLVSESGLKGFSDMITQVCCTYLGLEKEHIAWMGISVKYDVEEFMREILEAGVWKVFPGTDGGASQCRQIRVCEGIPSSNEVKFPKGWQECPALAGALGDYLK